MNRIEVKNLRFSYRRGEEILKGMDLTFDSESTAIIGQNGAGKTTFVKLLKGLLKPTEGDIFIKGKNTTEVTVAKLAKEIGMVFQNPNDQIFKSKVIDEVMFGPLNIGQGMEEAKGNSLKALELMELSDKVDENPYDLSLSERKLITIASILAMDTDIVIFDEPTISQDYFGKIRIKNIVKELAARGKLVITIAHDMDFVAEISERVIVLNKGEVILDGSAEEVFLRDDILKSAYLEQPNITQLCKRLGYDRTFLALKEFLDYRLAEN
ncbi:MAG: cobalt ABC transporter ATP-binding protein [Caldiserica bacterium CG02_land_8_20_14_3_00_36_38]|nr:ABC transporter ATP-binding protein [Caldisericota bacterium]OIP12178.1 MAG: cobalt ABC transporter ATP-binding protein [Caldisericum sp. CG2_30_36_11]PIP49906.1 MAG: cobalt ABC transporter ATP-binding protein [Caldiserica bacterium CG23_combo_of_CG06-09_8_20_14_all_35_60]PIV55534.1 MAG: cobalt ABC transporter ATP-binding protein [Caldiserica bacterium CG02_land_8_20_14_3_00_36_38]PIW10545.1 MAG: cobalt ABC transporter ATP-binding protein [Caldiserica bacterium CG17_big_fil_post_rev_8_21_14_